MSEVDQSCGCIIIAIGDREDNGERAVVRQIEIDMHAWVNGPPAPAGQFDGHYGGFNYNVDAETKTAIADSHPASTIALLKWAISRLRHDLNMYEQDQNDAQR